MTTVLETSQLSKTYGRLRALDGLDLHIESGHVYGILGPNGSGKTTALGILLGITKATSGSYRWFGGIGEKAARMRIGALLETPNFYPYLNAEQNLAITAHIKQSDRPRIGELLELVNLAHRRQAPFKAYSLGMKQRLAIAAAMVGDPDVLIFDEPTNGLDPQGIAEVRGIVQRIAERGKTIIMASHILDEVEKICSHVAIIKNGKLLANGPVSSIINGASLLEIAADDMARLAQVLEASGLFGPLQREANLWLAPLKEGTDSGEVNQMAFQNGLVLRHLRIRPRSLEKEFLEITR